MVNLINSFAFLFDIIESSTSRILILEHCTIARFDPLSSETLLFFLVRDESLCVEH